MDYEGLLGNDFNEQKNHVIKTYENLFNFHREFNVFLTKTKLDISVKNDDHQGIVMVAIFTKSVDTFQSIYLLFTHCLLSQGLIMTRALFEELAAIGYCNKGNSELNRFMAKELYKKKKLLNVIKSNPSFFPKEITDKSKIDKHRKWIDKKIDEAGDPSEISVYEMANAIKLPSYYETFYRIASNEVHNEPFILDRYLNFSDNGYIESFVSAPATSGYARYLISSFEFLLMLNKINSK
jgi:hypothetical protein